MNTPNPRSEIPEGVRDRLPREAARMRHVFGRLEDVFRAWGYREVITPVFEYLETVVAGAGTLGKKEDLYQLFDRKGRTLALRADMTTPIARLVATKMTGEPLPLRLSYFAPVFRHRDKKAGSVHEIWQAGVELIGAPGPAADAEVVALACTALTRAGVNGVKIGLGHVGLVEGVFGAAGVGASLEAELKEAMVSRDLVAFEKGVSAAGLDKKKADLLLSLATFQGSHDEAIGRFSSAADERIISALGELGTILSLLDSFGVSGQVSLDLGLVRSLEYYTGVVFEGYAPGVGAPVLGGGRYDNLLGDFGGDLPATGFAVEVDRLLAALERQCTLEDEPGVDAIVECPPGGEAHAAARARHLRELGLKVEVDILGRRGEELQAYARSRNAARVFLADGGGAVETVFPRNRAIRGTAVASIH